jgi:hypothetical protein
MRENTTALTLVKMVARGGVDADLLIFGLGATVIDACLDP